jgi:hypothetical protein
MPTATHTTMVAERLPSKIHIPVGFHPPSTEVTSLASLLDCEPKGIELTKESLQGRLYETSLRWAKEVHSNSPLNLNKSLHREDKYQQKFIQPNTLPDRIGLQPNNLEKNGNSNDLTSIRMSDGITTSSIPIKITDECKR